MKIEKPGVGQPLLGQAKIKGGKRKKEKIISHRSCVECHVLYVVCPLGRVIFVKNIQTCRLRFLIVSLGALINHKTFQHDSSTHSWSKFEIEFTLGITKGNAPKNRISSKRHFLIVLVQI